jgi:hypothetical protein
MISEQMGLFRHKIRHTEEDLARLEEYLTWANGWRTARRIKDDLGMDDRYIRKLAEASVGRILGTDAGYRLTSKVTPDEFNEWRGRYESQVKRMLERLQRTTSQWHRRGSL